jgi:hypothetical protein
MAPAFNFRGSHSCRYERRPETNENQPRRNEEREDFFRSSFALFVSSWLIFWGAIA